MSNISDLGSEETSINTIKNYMNNSKHMNQEDLM